MSRRPRVARDPQLDTSSNVGVKRREAELLMEQIEELSALKMLMSEPWGRKLLWSWLKRAAIFREAFSGSGQSELTAYRLGEQAWGRKVFATIMSEPELIGLYTRMAQEAERASEARTQREGEIDAESESDR